MRVQDKPQPLALPCGFEKKGLERRIKIQAPIGVRADLPVGEVRHQIEHLRAAILQPVGRVLE